MTGAPGWEDQLVRELVGSGLDEVEARQLAGDALDEALEAGRDPADLYGPAVAYAGTLARTLRSAVAPAPLTRMAGPVVLRLRGVGKHYGRRTVLRDVDLTLRAGEVAAVVGANGSGKSTLLHICAGLTRASGGIVERTPRVGFAPQDHGLAPLLTADEHFRLFGAAYGMAGREATAVGTRLAGRLGWRPRPDVVAGRLSGGTRQKLNVVLAELHRPDLLLLDEPYQGLDRDAYLDLWEQIAAWRDAGAGVLVVTHLLRDLDLVDHVIELRPMDEA